MALTTHASHQSSVPLVTKKSAGKPTHVRANIRHAFAKVALDGPAADVGAVMRPEYARARQSPHAGNEPEADLLPVLVVAGELADEHLLLIADPHDEQRDEQRRWDAGPP